MKNIMYLRYFFFTIVVVVLVLLIAYSIHVSAVPSTNPTFGVQGASEKPSEAPPEVAALNSTAQTPAMSQSASSQNGLSILESRCARCHTAHWLMKTKKTRTEWEKTLTQMETNGVLLSDTEKDDLIDYLVFSAEP